MSLPMACLPFPLPLLQQPVLLPQQRCPAKLCKFLLNGQLYSVASSTALAQVLVKLYLSYCTVLLMRRSDPGCLLCVPLKSRFLARHLDHVTISC